MIIYILAAVGAFALIGKVVVYIIETPERRAYQEWRKSRLEYLQRIENGEQVEKGWL